MFRWDRESLIAHLKWFQQTWIGPTVRGLRPMDDGYINIPNPTLSIPTRKERRKERRKRVASVWVLSSSFPGAASPCRARSDGHGRAAASPDSAATGPVNNVWSRDSVLAGEALAFLLWFRIWTFLEGLVCSGVWPCLKVSIFCVLVGWNRLVNWWGRAFWLISPCEVSNGGGLFPIPFHGSAPSASCDLTSCVVNEACVIFLMLILMSSCDLATWRRNAHIEGFPGDLIEAWGAHICAIRNHPSFYAVNPLDVLFFGFRGFQRCWWTFA